MIKWSKILLAGFIYLIISTLVNQVEAFMSLKYYMMPQYFGVWSKLMMPKAGPPPANFYITSLLFSFISGIGLALFYNFIKDLLPKEKWQRKCKFTCITLGLMVIFFYFPLILLINLPSGLLISWFISNTLVIFLSSMVFVKVIK